MLHFLAFTLIAAAKVAAHPSMLERFFTLAQVCAATAAVGTVAVFAWAKLRLDRAWDWLFKHIKEDRAAARTKEYIAAWSDPEMTQVRVADVGQAVKVTIGPAIDNINKRIDDHMLREEEAAQENLQYMREHADSIHEISSKVDAINVEQKKVSADLKATNDDRMEKLQIFNEHIEEDHKFQTRVEPYLAKVDTIVSDTVEGAKENTQNMGQQILDAIHELKTGETKAV